MAGGGGIASTDLCLWLDGARCMEPHATRDARGREADFSLEKPVENAWKGDVVGMWPYGSTWIMGLARLGIPQYSPNIDVLKHPAFNQSSSLYKMRLHVKVESLPKCEYKWKGVISTLHPRWVFILSDGSERPARGMLSYKCLLKRPFWYDVRILLPFSAICCYALTRGSDLAGGTLPTRGSRLHVA